MTETHQVLFLLKTRYQNPHDRISHIGGLNSDGTNWNLTLARAVDAIERSKWKFYLMRNGTSFDLIVATTRLGNKYLKTTADRQQPIGLLALPACAVTVVASATPATYRYGQGCEVGVVANSHGPSGKVEDREEHPPRLWA